MARTTKTKKSWREKLADDKDLPKVGLTKPRHTAIRRRLEAEGHRVTVRGKR